MILAIYTQQKQKEGCEKTQSSFFTSPFFVKKGLDKEKMYVIVVVEQIKQQLEQMGKICFMEVYL